MGSLLAIFVAVVAVDIVLLGAVHYLVAGVVVLLVWQFFNFAFAVPIQARILNGARSAPNLAATLVSTAFNIGISVGAAIGSIALTHGLGYGQLPAIGIVATLLAIALTLISRGLDRREAVASAALKA
jgi:DHA1 family inner membrane transport protein